VLALRSAYASHDHFFVLNDQVPLPEALQGKTFFIRHSERDWLFFANLWEAWHIIRQERPTILLSTGAGPIVPFAIIGKLMGTKIIFVETIARLSRPSLTGRIMYRLADRFFYQWKSLQSCFPNGIYGGRLI
jgi:UDP-N-acetylglucosamine:LPS N-acetylglucosamine transferase